MTGLSDLEVLLGRIGNNAIVDYMREAMTSYYVGAYRGCVVLSYIALFDDLSQKLKELSRINSTAREIWKEVESRQNQQKVFETYMIDKLEKEKLLSIPETELLRQITAFRNKAAHPSGVQTSPEGARFVFFEVIDKFLSKPLLLTTQAADALLERLENTNFFPSKYINDTKEIVNDELEGLSKAAYPYLVEKLVTSFKDKNEVIRANSILFMISFSSISQDEITENIRQRLVKGKADDSNYSTLIVSVSTANPDVLLKHNKSTTLRLKRLLRNTVDTAEDSLSLTSFRHPAQLLAAMHDSAEKDEFLSQFGEFAEKTVKKYVYAGSILKFIAKSEKLRSTWYTQLKENAGSAEFGAANLFAERVSELDDTLSEIITKSEALELISAVCKAASFNAFKSMDLRQNRFSYIPKIRRLAIDFARNSPKKGQKILSDAYIPISLDDFLGNTLGDKKDD